MRGKSIFSLAVASASALAMTAPAGAAITFLDHFNGQTALTLNPANGDYAAGGGMAVLSSPAPGTDTGFFGPGDLAFHVDGTSTSETFEHADIDGAGNIQYTSATSGGITVGLWLKITGSYQATNIIQLGAKSSNADDNLVLDYGQSSAHKTRLDFIDKSGPGHDVTLAASSGTDASDWIYIAATVDLTHATESLYVFDQNGTLQGSGDSTPITLTDWNVNNLGQVRIGDTTDTPATTGVWIDEVSIDDQALSISEIQARVDSMVGGHELAVPEPVSLGLMAFGGLLMLRRRKSA
jgi:hypothetical protein